MSALFELDDMGFAYGGRAILTSVGVRFQASELVAIVGPNGAGKSTFMGVCGGIRSPYTGRCRYRDREVRLWERKAFAREVGFVPQNLLVEFPFTAGQVVMMGRAPYGDGLFESSEDFAAAREAMELTDSLQFAERDFRSLSGGERQRVVLASALAQSPKVLLLDEPTTFLDLRHQLAIYELLKRLSRSGLLVVTVTHDLNLALSYADQVLILDDGRIRSSGTPSEVLTPANIELVFGVPCTLHTRPDGRRWMTYA